MSDDERFSVRDRHRVEILTAPDEGGVITGARTHLQEGAASSFPLTVLRWEKERATRAWTTKQAHWHYWATIVLTPEHTLQLTLPARGVDERA